MWKEKRGETTRCHTTVGTKPQGQGGEKKGKTRHYSGEHRKRGPSGEQQRRAGATGGKPSYFYTKGGRGGRQNWTEKGEKKVFPGGEKRNNKIERGSSQRKNWKADLQFQ